MQEVGCWSDSDSDSDSDMRSDEVNAVQVPTLKEAMWPQVGSWW